MRVSFRARAPARNEIHSSLALGLRLIALGIAFFAEPLAFAEAPPVVGRPVDFSGAIGGPFVIQWVAEPTEVTAEAPITLALRIVGPGNLQSLPRPALGKLESFKAFAVEDLDDHFVPGDPPRREFRYRVRPRSTAVKEIPRFKLVYFNPRIMPASRGYQTTYADAVPLTVKPRAASVAAIPVPAFIEREWIEQEEYWDRMSTRSVWATAFDNIVKLLGRSVNSAGALAIALLSPLAICCLGYLAWRRAFPDAARATAIGRSRAATAAVRTLRAVGEDPGRGVFTALIVYLHARMGMPRVMTTPEIVAHLKGAGQPAQRLMDLEELLRRCDQARFALGGQADAKLAADAERLVLDWEASQ